MHKTENIPGVTVYHDSETSLYNIKYNMGSEKLRLDKILVASIKDTSRSTVINLIKSGKVSVNSKVILKQGFEIKSGDEIKAVIPTTSKLLLSPHHNIVLDVIFEDDDILIINKPAGLTVHPGAGYHQDTLVNILLQRYGLGFADIGQSDRPGIVHRLDMNTSGAMVVAKNNRAHVMLSDMIANKEIKREYIALVYGRPTPHIQTIKTQFARSKKNPKTMCVVKSGGRIAITHIELLQSFYTNTLSLIKCKLETGRTHQIRVHLSHISHPIVGDKTYGASKNHNLSLLPEETKKLLKSFNRQCLHSKTIEFIHPISKEMLKFEAEEPDDIKTLIRRLSN